MVFCQDRLYEAGALKIQSAVQLDMMDNSEIGHMHNRVGANNIDEYLGA